ncbi:hypothetical protein [Streptomyces albus]|uniref:hypothetical protein n=1 Tax=Streptomyces albus TaxID=1888 RepID=UPI0004C91380|nr:hypothetical protein [Streptomyces albus]
MGFDEEWQQARAEAANRMRLAGADDGTGRGEPGTSAADLALSSRQLKSIGHEAYELYAGLSAGGKHASGTSDAAAVDLKADGFATGSALATAVDTWNSQVSTLKDACARIQMHLEGSTTAHHEHERDVVAKLSVSKIDQYFR